MLAYILNMGLAIELALYVVGGMLLVRHGGVDPGSMSLIALGIFLSVRVVLLGLSFLWAWIHRARRPPEMRIRLGGTLRLFASEFGAFLTLYGALQPLEAWLARRRLKNQAVQAGIPVLLIHGYFCNSAYWWAMERYLREQGIGNIFPINLEPVFGSIDQYAAQLADSIEHICKLTGASQTILVAHSMGGLAARAYLRRYGGRRRVAKIITLGSPHNGTEHSRLALRKSQNIQQMRRDSRWLAELNAAEADPEPVPITSIHSTHDNIIAPQNSSVLNHSHVKNIAVPGIGHLAMTFSKPLQAIVYQEIIEVIRS
jgi:pimeloyl-ACP methyl ester carboxylesterase